MNTRHHTSSSVRRVLRYHGELSLPHPCAVHITRQCHGFLKFHLIISLTFCISKINTLSTNALSQISRSANKRLELALDAQDWSMPRDLTSTLSSCNRYSALACRLKDPSLSRISSLCRRGDTEYFSCEHPDLQDPTRIYACSTPAPHNAVMCKEKRENERKKRKGKNLRPAIPRAGRVRRTHGISPGVP